MISSIVKPSSANSAAASAPGIHVVKSEPGLMTSQADAADGPFVADLMTRTVVTVGIDDPLISAAQLLRSWTVSAVPVIDGRGQVVGIINYRDLLVAAVARLADGTDESLGPGSGGPAVVGEIMSRPVVSIGPDETVAQAASLMLDRRMRWLPVIAEGELVGVISRADLVAIMLREDGDIADDVESRLATLDGGPRLVDVSVSVKDAVVTLTGEAAVSSATAAAVRAARAVPGVRAVRDCIRRPAARTRANARNQHENRRAGRPGDWQ